MRILLASRGFAQTAQQSLATHVANGEENGMADPEIASRPQVKAFIGLGSNVGDRFEMIESACREMEKLDIRIHKLSHLYETKAMYVEDQAPFLNGVCEIESALTLGKLFDALQSVEMKLGRRKTIDKGPRNIDLDILLWDDLAFDQEDLTIPHQSMLERSFVLRPLRDINGNGRMPFPMPQKTFKEHLKALEEKTPNDPQPKPLSRIAPSLPPIATRSPFRKTQMMAVLNLTPDSFSDGGLHSSSDPTDLIPLLRSFVSAGTTILDIGGQSTRPHAPEVSPSVELGRILPTIQLIRSLSEFSSLAISVDTYRASVARAAIKAGANIINDVSAGSMDQDMLSTAAELGVTIILMHMRGTPQTMNDLTTYPTGVIYGIRTELLRRVNAALAAGIPPWRIVLDPGIGFAKTQAQNLEILRAFNLLTDIGELKNYPWCIGTSRKGFIGKITGVKEPAERAWGTAAAVSAAVKGGADIVRVHDVKEMAAVVKMADAIWRVGDKGKTNSKKDGDTS